MPPVEIEVPFTRAPPTITSQIRRIPPSFAIQRLKDECLIPSADTSASNSVWPPLVVSTNPGEFTYLFALLVVNSFI